MGLVLVLQYCAVGWFGCVLGLGVVQCVSVLIVAFRFIRIGLRRCRTPGIVLGALPSTRLSV